MTYASLEEIKAVIPERDLILLTDDTGAADTVDDAKVILALEDATAEINGYLSKRVTLPLENPPRILAVHCREIARYRLFANRGTVTETIQKMYDASIVYLKMVAEGKVSIGDEDAEDTVDSTPGVVISEGPERVMSRKTLGSF
jgi:phage gp36-like protein